MIVEFKKLKHGILIDSHSNLIAIRLLIQMKVLSSVKSHDGPGLSLSFN